MVMQAVYMSDDVTPALREAYEAIPESVREFYGAAGERIPEMPSDHEYQYQSAHKEKNWERYVRSRRLLAKYWSDPQTWLERQYRLEGREYTGTYRVSPKMKIEEQDRHVWRPAWKPKLGPRLDRRLYMGTIKPSPRDDIRCRKGYGKACPAAEHFYPCSVYVRLFAEHQGISVGYARQVLAWHSKNRS